MVVCANGKSCAFPHLPLDKAKHFCMVCKKPLHGVCATEVTECSYAVLNVCEAHKSRRNNWRAYEVGGGGDAEFPESSDHDPLLDHLMEKKTTQLIQGMILRQKLVE